MEATITAKKGTTVKCRVFNPAQNKWWNGAAWTATEANAALTTLAVTVLANAYEDRYTGTVAVPSGTGYIVEYIDASTSALLGEDEIPSPVTVAFPLIVEDISKVSVPITDPIRAAKGETVTLLRQLTTSDGVPVDISADTIKFAVKEKKDSTTYLIEPIAATFVTDGTDGKFQIEVTFADKLSGYYEIVRFIGGTVRKNLTVPGGVQISVAENIID